MLCSFRVSNHRSIQEEQVLDLVTSQTGHGESLPVVALYGANASGKTNVLDALMFMQWAVAVSQTQFAPLGGIPRDPFAWGPARDEPSLFEATFQAGGITYEYAFVVDSQRVLEEWLYAWPAGRKQTWFERDTEGFKFGEHLKGENRLIEKLTRPNSLFLSAAAQNGHEQLLPVFAWFTNIRAGGWKAPRRSTQQFVSWWNQALIAPAISGTHAARFLELLKSTDVGIVEVRIGGDAKTPRVEARHKSSVPDAWLSLDRESEGTQRFFDLGPVIVDTMESGGLLVVDELEASLHPMLALRLLRAFNDLAENPKRAQLLFSTHDTNLLGNVTGAPALTRDEVWFTEKDAEGATKLYPLTDFKPRKTENLERGYLQGRYGAIPFLGSVARVGKAKS